jgi:probable phosphoglycerate mutase
MQLILVRHGQTEWNRLNKMQGQKDSPLTERGRLQADLAGRALSAYEINQFYCSDAGRAWETVERLLKVNPRLPLPHRDARLRELNYGNWEGLLRKEIEDTYPELFKIYMHHPASFRAPNGEAFRDLQDRLLSFLSEMPRADNENCLIVTHGGLIRVALLTLTNKRLEELNNTPPIREASISRFQWTDGIWTVLERNNTQHIDGRPDSRPSEDDAMAPGPHPRGPGGRV